MASKAGGSQIDVILSEAERNCEDHTLRVLVSHRRGSPSRRPAIIAGLLRVLAENTDGWCANRGATDEDLITTGMVFSFTSDDKRDEFIARLPQYLSASVRQQITAAKI
jgi:hypothetical protein